MTRYWKNTVAMICLCVPVLAFAGSYDDMLQAIEIDDERGVTALLKRGVDPDIVTQKGESLLMVAARSAKPGVVKAILAARPKVNSRNAQGETALMLAAIGGRLEIVRMLLDGGAEPNQPGWTPLIYAAVNNHVEVARLLLARNAQVDATAENGMTALMMAAREGQLQMVLLLLEHGADVNYTSPFGANALSVALEKGRKDVVTVLTHAGAKR